MKTLATCPTLIGSMCGSYSLRKSPSMYVLVGVVSIVVVTSKHCRT